MNHLVPFVHIREASIIQGSGLEGFHGCCTLAYSMSACSDLTGRPVWRTVVWVLNVVCLVCVLWYAERQALGEHCALGIKIKTN